MTRPFGFSDELFEAANRECARQSRALFENTGRRRHPPQFGVAGATANQIKTVEAHLGYSLPPDLRYLAQHTSDPDGVIFRWIHDVQAIDQFTDWVLSGIRSDVEHSLFWLTRWGHRPDDPSVRLDIASDDIAGWPTLIPLEGHRAIPLAPSDAGNPVFSLMQTDIIYYGTTLADWMALDLTPRSSESYATHVRFDEIRRIPIWSDFAEQTEGFIASCNSKPE